MAGKKGLPVLLPNGTPPSQSNSSQLPSNGQKQVLRVNRACNACRKQKMRCEGPENPPCVRCKANGVQCVFEKVPKGDGDQSERLKTLETQFASMQGTLVDILSELRKPSRNAPDSPRRGSSTSSQVPSYQQPTIKHSPPAHPTYSHSPASHSSYSPSVDPTPPAQPSSLTNAPHRPALGYQYQPQLPQQLPSLHSVIPQHYHSPPGSNAGFGSRPTGPHYSNYPPSYPHTNYPHTAPHPHRRLPDPGSPYRPALLSGITSAANSDDEGDIPSSALLAPIGVLNDLASVAAQSDGGSRHGLKRKRGERSSPGAHSSRPAPSRSPHTYTHSPLTPYPAPGLPLHSNLSDTRSEISHRPSLQNMRRDSEISRGTSTLRDEEHDHDVHAEEPRGVEGGEVEAVEEEHIRERERDAIEKGIVGVEEAEELHQIYFTGCYRVLAVFNKAVDTLDSLRARSPFLLNCILMAASKARDGGSPPSPTQLALVRECSCMAKEYLFGPLKSVEIVQGLLLIAGWSHSTGPTGWLAAGHAIRYAVELGLHKALPRLSRRRNVGAGVESMSDSEKALIIGARTWCGLYVFEYQISFGTGRPAMMRGDKSLIRARDILLKHPLSIPTDARLVSTCELMTLQSKIHDSLGPLDEPVNEDRVIESLRQSIVDLDAWLAEWTGIMSDLGLDARDMQFFYSSAQIQMLYAHLFHHCIALRNLHTVADAKALRPEMKEVALRAIEYARTAITVCLENNEYRIGLRYAISYSHTCAAFAGAFLLRLTRLFPQDLDVPAMIVMVEQLANLLDEVPAGRFARSLFQMIKVSQARLHAKQAALPAPPTTSTPTTSLPGPEYTNDFAQLIHPSPGMFEFSGVAFGNQALASDITHGLLSMDGDWPEWIQNSIYGDLPMSSVGVYPDSGQAEYGGVPGAFAWNSRGVGP